MAVDIDPKTGAPIVSGSLHTGDGPILTIPPVVSTPTTESKSDNDGKSFSAEVAESDEPPVFSSRKDELLYLMNKLVDEAGGISNIGMTSDYWKYQNEYRTL